MYFDFQFRCSKRCSVSIAALAVHVATSIPNWTDQFWLPYFRVPDTTAVLDHSVQYGRNSRRYHKEVYMCLYVERRRVFGDSELCARSRRNAGDRGDAPRPSECG